MVWIGGHGYFHDGASGVVSWVVIFVPIASID
jgi:hypothetical protein